MELDMEFSIAILEAMEQHSRAVIEPEESLSSDIDQHDERFSYHCLMLTQAGLIEVWPCSNSNMYMGSEYAYISEGMAVARFRDGGHGVVCSPMILTYEGHRFLDALRSEPTRGKVEEFVREKGLPWTFTIAKDVVSRLVFQQMSGV